MEFKIGLAGILQGGRKSTQLTAERHMEYIGQQKWAGCRATSTTPRAAARAMENMEEEREVRKEKARVLFRANAGFARRKGTARESAQTEDISEEEQEETMEDSKEGRRLQEGH